MAPGEPIQRGPAGRPPTDDLIASMQPFAALPISGVPGFSGDLPPRLLGEVALAALHCFLPRDEDASPDAADDAYSSDEFRMYEFKIRRCPRGRSHDWTECPYAHPGEKARRRDPLRVHYSGTACPDFRRGGGCRRGDACHLAHGVFETWLHPARYRTQPCKDGAACPRRVCFFAHSPQELRVVLPSSPTSPGKGDSVMSSSPTSTLMMTLPPASPPSDGSSPPLSPVAIDEVVAAMTKLQLSRVRSGPPFGTRRGGEYASCVCSVPQTPVRRAAAAWGLRGTLSDYCQRREQEEAAPDFGWVSDLVKD